MDREKVIEALEFCKDNQHVNDCNECDYGGKTGMFCIRMIDDALSLLKEHGAVEPKFVRNEWRCGACGHVVLTYCFDINEGEMGKVMANYCPSCGRKVKWE